MRYIGQTTILANTLFSNSHLSAFANTNHISLKYKVSFHILTDFHLKKNSQFDDGVDTYVR